MEVPFFDLKKQYYSIKDEISTAISEVLESSWFVAGPHVKKFEEGFAKFCGVRYCIGVSSGTTAVYLALRALDIGSNDEVITTVNTFMATAEAISLTGALPVFVDIDEKSYNMNAERVKEFIEKRCRWVGRKRSFIDRRTKRTLKAILPVHLYGQMADMKPIMEIADKYGIFVVEDAAQAHGAEYNFEGKQKRAGTFGNCAAFSFYPSKNLGAYGNGGAVVTNDEGLADRVQMLINHGQRRKYYHDILGWNYKMNGFQGAILDVKLKYLEEWNRRRIMNGKLYNELFKGVEGVVIPFNISEAKHIYHLYVIRVKKRDELQKYLKSQGIGTSIHYPIPLHMQQAYQHLGYHEGDFPVAEAVSKEIVSLPMFPELKEDEIAYVVDRVKEFVSAGG